MPHATAERKIAQQPVQREHEREREHEHAGDAIATRLHADFVEFGAHVRSDNSSHRTESRSEIQAIDNTAHDGWTSEKEPQTVKEMLTSIDRSTAEMGKKMDVNRYLLRTLEDAAHSIPLWQWMRCSGTASGCCWAVSGRGDRTLCCGSSPS